MTPILIPTPLRAYTGKQDTVHVSGATIGEALNALTAQFGDLRQHLFTTEGKLRNFVNIYVNDEDIRYLQKEATPLKPGDTVSIVPSVAGGSASASASAKATADRVGTAADAKTSELTPDDIKRY